MLLIFVPLVSHMIEFNIFCLVLGTDLSLLVSPLVLDEWHCICFCFPFSLNLAFFWFSLSLPFSSYALSVWFHKAIPLFSLCFPYRTHSFQNQIWLHFFDYRCLENGIQLYFFPPSLSGTSNKNFICFYYFIHYSLACLVKTAIQSKFLIHRWVPILPQVLPVLSSCLVHSPLFTVKLTLTHIIIPLVSALFRTLTRITNAHKNKKALYINIKLQCLIIIS